MASDEGVAGFEVPEEVPARQAGNPVSKQPILAAVAKTIHKMREDYRAERNRVLEESAGCMSDEEAAVFEEALKESRRIDAN